MTPSVESDTNNQSNNDDAAASVGKCPVDPKNRSLWNVLGINNKEDQVKPEHEVIPGVDPTKPIRIPASVEEAAKYAQTPQPDQRLPLSTHRAMSTIPRGSSKEGEEDNPHHQAGSQSPTWVYPSEQQVFNAMKRKGWQGIEEESIPSFLQIHNSVNERSWRQVQAWESNKDITLVKFQGRPNDLTPKAWIWSNILMQQPPFDRHDWYVDNGIESESPKRYVLDFYMEDDSRSGIPRVDIDVRPALDTPNAFVARASRVASELFPGIAKELQRLNQSSSSSQS